MRLRIAAASIAVLLLAGCGAARRGPESVPLDRVNCGRCGMVISSEVHAAQIQLRGQGTRFFDDIGCLASDSEARADGADRYVRLVSGVWANADGTWFAVSDVVRTPMHHGVLAFANEDEARRADRDGQARTWPAIVELAQTR